MSKKSATPALYEKMRTRPSAGPAVGGSAPRMIEPAPRSLGAETGPTWLGPGRMLRMPVGYVLLAAAATFALIVVTYIVAFKRGQVTGQAEMAEMVTDLKGTEPRVMSDPLIDLNSSPVGTPVRSVGSSPGTARPAAPAAVRPSSSWGAVASDPRRKGINYFVLAETQESGARRIAEFCRSNGLETYVVSGNNDRLRRVIVLPGFESGARSSPEIKSLEQRIQDIGEKWAKAARGNSNFRGAYPKLHNG